MGVHPVAHLRTRFVRVGGGALLWLLSIMSMSAWAAPPSASLVFPVDTAAYATPAAVLVSVAASDSDGTIAKVEVFIGATLIGTFSSPPYSAMLNITAPGSYPISAKVTDNSGAVTTTGTAVINVYAVATGNAVPSVNLAMPVNGAAYKAPASIPLQVSASDPDNGLNRVEYYINGGLLGAITAAPYSATWNNVGAGTYTVVARAYDNLGASVSSTASTFTVSAPVTGNTPPTVSMISPVNGNVLAPPAAFSVAANATDTNGSVNRVEFYLNGILLATDTAAPYSLDLTSVPEGLYQFQAVAYDSVGEYAITSPTTIAVTHLPTVSLDSPAHNSVHLAPATYSLNATASDVGGAISKVEFYSGSTKLGEDTSAPYAYSITNQPAGVYSYSAKAFDNLGVSKASSTVSVIVNQPPTVALVSPSNNSVYAAPASFTLQVNASDADSGVAKVEFYAGSTKLGEDATAPYTWGISGLPTGTYSYSAKAIDAMGAVASSSAVTVTVGASGNQPPVANLTAPANNAVFPAPASFTLTANASDTDGSIARVEFYRGVTKLGEDTTAPYSWAVSNLAAGTYTYKVKAVDNQGATYTSNPITVVSNSLPTVTLTAPAAGTYTATRPIKLTATASDSGGSIAKVEFFDGAALIRTVTAPPYEFNWSGMAAGSHSITAKATDNLAGQKTAAAVSITVNASNTAPTVSLTAPTTSAPVHLPATVTLKASASDSEKNDGVQRVEFYAGTTLLGTDTSAPYSWVWSPPPGVHALTAKAIDFSGASTQTAAKTITANSKPTVTLHVPSKLGGYNSPADLVLTADAQDADGSIAKVQFFSGATLLYTDTSRPFTYTHANLGAGSYAYTAKAFDNLGAITESNVVDILIADELSPLLYQYDELGRLIGVQH